MKRISTTPALQIGHIVEAYALTETERDDITNMMAAAYLHAKQVAYQRAHTTAGHRISLPVWRLGDADATKAHEWAKPLADGIAETYKDLLRSQLEQMAQQDQEKATTEAEDDDSETPPSKGSALGDILTGIGLATILQKIGEWFTGLLGWKPDQIADNTALVGDNDGTKQFIQDVISSGTGQRTLRARVIPAESSSDFCKDYAGKSYTLEEMANIISFPAHPNCVHSIEIYVVDEQGNEVAA